MTRQWLGQKGEAVATQFLIEKSYQIVARNYRTRLGEIDIIAQTPTLEIVFVEVKTYQTTFIDPRLVITAKKKRHLVLVAQCFIVAHNLNTHNFRFDLMIVRDQQVVDHIIGIMVT